MGCINKSKLFILKIYYFRIKIKPLFKKYINFTATYTVNQIILAITPIILDAGTSRN